MAPLAVRDSEGDDEDISDGVTVFTAMENWFSKGRRKL